MADIFAEIEELKATGGNKAAVDRLVQALEEGNDCHGLFGALLLQKRVELGLPLLNPAETDDVPDDKYDDFKECYLSSARKVGGMLLDQGRLAEAWPYFSTIGEPGPIREALDAVDPERDPEDDSTQDLINLALYEGAHPVKGLEIMLRVNGTCNTVTALDQYIGYLEPDQRRQAAAMMVRELYDDLRHTVSHEIEQKLAGVEVPETLRDMLSGRDWLFEEDNYHIDVSHLNAVVRFARHLAVRDDELDRATQLAEYGSKLAAQFQYPGDPPFDDFYPAHIHYFHALADEKRDEAIQYFRDQIEQEPDEEDKPVIAMPVVELLMQIDRKDEAVAIASQYLAGFEDPNGFSYRKFCEEQGRLDLLATGAREQNDLVGFAGALMQQG